MLETENYTVEIPVPISNNEGYLSTILTLRTNYQPVEPITIIAHGLFNHQLSETVVSWCGNSCGATTYSDYPSQVLDLNLVVKYFYHYQLKLANQLIKLHIQYILGHSKGGSVVNLFGSIHNLAFLQTYPVPYLINLNGRYHLNQLSQHRFTQHQLDLINQNQTVAWNQSKLDTKPCYVSQSDFLWRNGFVPNQNFKPSGNYIKSRLTVHGKLDKVVPVEDAIQFHKLLDRYQRNNQLEILETGGHTYTQPKHRLLLEPVLKRWYENNT